LIDNEHIQELGLLMQSIPKNEDLKNYTWESKTWIRK